MDLKASSVDAEDTSHLESSSDELIGRCLNDTYQIEAVLGEGGVGRVYRARHTRIKTKQYALKVLHAEHSRDPQQLARFQREAEAAASLSHPNVVGVFDFGRTEDGYSYLACELLHGIDLDGYLEKHGRLSVPAAIHIAIEICVALESAHAQNIVHRDLKPQNVFLMSGLFGEIAEFPPVKLVDFGLSRFLDHADAQLTKTGTLMGTPTFMAPEQATGQRGDHRVDIYGVGVILYVALTGRPPFDEETLPAMLVAVMTADPPRPRRLVPEIPEGLELLVQRAMAKSPDERYQSISELRSGLEAAVPLKDSVKMQAPGRMRLNSTLQQSEEAYELRTSRFRLVFYGLVAVLLFIACLTAAVSGLELFTGPFEFSSTELILIMAGICGTIATPAVLAFRHFKRTIWSNSAKVVDALARIQGPVVAGLITYGAGVIAIRFGDDFFGRLGPNTLFDRRVGIGWAGFTWVLPGAALLAASITYLKRRLSEGPNGSRRRAWLGAPLRLISILVVTVLLWLGMTWRGDHLAALDAEAAAKEALASAAPTTGAIQAENPKPAPPEPIRLASDEELASALAQGADGLLPLSEKYPKDARVLEPLLVEFASRATGFADAMVTTKQLLEVAPEKRDSEALGVMIRRAADSPGKASDIAFELMQKNLGQAGPDLLYQLSKARSKSSERAAQALQLPEVKARMSPALRIAIELETAASCEARLPLLARAKALGDARAASQLLPLARGSKGGCGKWKNRPCPAQCQEQATEYLDAAQAIQLRGSGTSL